MMLDGCRQGSNAWGVRRAFHSTQREERRPSYMQARVPGTGRGPAASRAAHVCLPRDHCRTALFSVLGPDATPCAMTAPCKLLCHGEPSVAHCSAVDRNIGGCLHHHVSREDPCSLGASRWDATSLADQGCLDSPVPRVNDSVVPRFRGVYFGHPAMLFRAGP